MQRTPIEMVGASSFAALEEFDLAKTLFGLFARFVRAAEIAAVGGEDLVALFGFDDHGGLLSGRGRQARGDDSSIR